VIEIFDDMFSREMLKKFEVICITTNGCIKKDKHYYKAVMGAGVAKQFSNMYPLSPSILGQKILVNGNIVQPIMKDYETIFVSFPTKHHFKDKSDINLISESCNQLLEYVNENNFKKILLPRPGCSNGGRNWEKEIKPILKKILDGRFYVITR